jgi:hypothetical protein
MDEDYNFQAAPAPKEEIPTGPLPPAQYQVGEDDSVSTFRKTKATVTKGSTVQSYSQGKHDDNSTTDKSKTDDGSSINTETTRASKKSKSSLNSKTIASELTSSMDTMNQNVQSMQAQFVALMTKLDVMNNRVGILEVGPRPGNPPVAPVPSVSEETNRPDGVSQKSTLPASSHPPEAKEGEHPA